MFSPRGKAVADILYLTPEGAPQVFLPPRSALDGTSVMPDRKGYTFDGCSPTFLMKNATVKDKMIVFPGGGAYHLLVLPDVSTMTPELVETIGKLAAKGAIIIGNPPLRSPSLVNYPLCDSLVRSATKEIWGKDGVPDKVTVLNYGEGKIITGKRLYHENKTTLRDEESSGLYPDYQLTASLLASDGSIPDFVSSGDLRYTHRSLPDRDIYFISNRTEKTVHDTCYFRNGTTASELWNPVTAEIIGTKSFMADNGSTAVPVILDPFQSYFVVFYHNKKAVKDESSMLCSLDKKRIFYTIEGPWNVAFDTAWGGPENIIFNTLEDWTKRPEEGIRYYSGTAVYRKVFDLPEEPSSPEKAFYFLDLGKLRNMGRIKLNGHDLGILWTTPWQVSITGILRAKGNELEVTVANLWINRLIGDEAQPWDGIVDGKWPDWLLQGTKRPTSRYTFTTHRYYRKEDTLSESGLIGPVTIKMAVATR